MAAIDPMHQFLVHKIVDLPPVQTPLGPLDLSITNSVASMLAGAAIVILFFLLSAKRQIVPGRMQAVGEAFYGLIDGVLVGPMMGHPGRPFIPFIFTIFMMVLIYNLMGIVLTVGNLFGGELAFTVTAQLAATATLALLTFASVLVVGFWRNGLKFFTLFVPKGVPILILPLGASAVTLGLGFILTFGRLFASPLLVPLAHTLIALPFVVRILQPALASIPDRLRQAAAILGASPLRAWLSVDWPIIRRAALTAGTFAFTAPRTTAV